MSPSYSPAPAFTVRPYRPADAEALARLFYKTVHAVCARDYTPAQLAAWAPRPPDTAAWDASLRRRVAFVAEAGDGPVGFGDIDGTGYLDRLYVRHDWQRRGVGTALCARLEAAVWPATVRTHASLTAPPFFAARGYRLVRAQQVERRGIWLTNFVMSLLQA